MTRGRKTQTIKTKDFEELGLGRETGENPPENAGKWHLGVSQAKQNKTKTTQKSDR